MFWWSWASIPTRLNLCVLNFSLKWPSALLILSAFLFHPQSFTGHFGQAWFWILSDRRNFYRICSVVRRTFGNTDLLKITAKTCITLRRLTLVLPTSGPIPRVLARLWIDVTFRGVENSYEHFQPTGPPNQCNIDSTGPTKLSLARMAAYKICKWPCSFKLCCICCQ